MENFDYFPSEFKTKQGTIPGAVCFIFDPCFVPATIRLSDCMHTENFDRDSSTLEACFLSEDNFRVFEEKFTPTLEESALIEFKNFMFENSERFFILVVREFDTLNLRKLLIHETSHLLYKFDARFKKLADKLTSSDTFEFREEINKDLEERGYKTTEFADETCAFMMEGEFPPPPNNLKLYFKLRRILKNTSRATFRDLYETFDRKIALTDA